MNVYTQCMGIRDVAMHLPISILYKISKPSFPEELRYYLLSERNLEDISCNHVDRLYKKYRKGDDIHQDIIKALITGLKLNRQIGNSLKYTVVLTLPAC
jgi:hypothetical protein